MTEGKLTERQVTALAAETYLSLPTVRKWSKGGKVTDTNRAALEKAAKKLGIARKSAEQVQAEGGR